MEDRKRPASACASASASSASATVAEDVLALESATMCQQVCKRRCNDFEKIVRVETQRIEETGTRVHVADKKCRDAEAALTRARREYERAKEERVQSKYCHEAAKVALEITRREKSEATRDCEEASERLAKMEHSKDVIAIDD